MAALVYCLLMTAWPVAGGVYSKLYCTIGQLLYSSISSNGDIHFAKTTDHSNDIHIIAPGLYDVNQHQQVNNARFRYSIHYGDYMPAAFFTALVIAAPLPFKRKGRVFIFGLLLLLAIVVCKLSVIVLGLHNDNLTLISASGFLWDSSTGIVFALFIWILITFRSDDWLRLLPHQKRIQG